MTECNIHMGGCNLESFCLARTNWQRINRAVGEALQGISLEDMTRPPEPHEELLKIGGPGDAAGEAPR